MTSFKPLGKLNSEDRPIYRKRENIGKNETKYIRILHKNKCLLITVFYEVHGIV